MLAAGRLHISQLLVVVSGLIAAALTLWGCFASIMINYLIPRELALCIVFILPLPCFMMSLWSWRTSVILLLMDFIVLGYLRAFMLTGNPQRNPFDSLGLAFLCPGLCMLVAYILAPKMRSRRTGDLWIL